MLKGISIVPFGKAQSYSFNFKNQVVVNNLLNNYRLMIISVVNNFNSIKMADEMDIYDINLVLDVWDEKGIDQAIKVFNQILEAKKSDKGE